MKTNRVLAPLLVAGLLFGSAACSKGDSDGAKKPKESAEKAEAGSKSGKDGEKGKDGHVSSPKLTPQPKLKDATGIRTDTTLAKCSTDPGDVSANGTVKNSSDKAADILVTVNWINAKYDVVARGVDALEDVGAGKSVDWKASAELGKGYGKVSCVLNVRRGSLA